MARLNGSTLAGVVLGSLTALGVASATPAATLRVIAIAPPQGDGAAQNEAGLLMQAEAAGRLEATGRVADLHVKQVLRGLERHHLDAAKLDQPETAERARRSLGATELVAGRITGPAGAWVLEVSGAGASGPLPARKVALKGSLPEIVDAGARALTDAVPGLTVPPRKGAGTGSPEALAQYGACYAVLIRQPISIEAPTLLQKDDLERATHGCRAAVRADPAFEAAWAALGLVLAIAGEDGPAVVALVHVHPEPGYLPLYWLGRYWLVTRYQEPDAGLRLLREAIKKHPGFLLARGYVAEHLMVTGHPTEAYDEWRAYSQVVPNNAFVRGRMSVGLARLSRFDEAIALAKEALAADPRDRDAILELGSRYLDAGRTDDAIATLSPAADGNARGELLLRLGWAFFAKQNFERAEALFRRAEQVSQSPSEWRTRARARADLARACDRRADLSGALSAVKRALEEGAGPYLHEHADKRLGELLREAEKTPTKIAAATGPRLLKPAELSPLPLTPSGDVDLQQRQFRTPPPQFELLRF